MADFLKYFDMDKETIKFLIHETKIRISDIEQVIELSCPEEQILYNKDLEYENEKLKALKLALVAVDDTAGISTVNFDDTLDLNRVYGGSTKKSRRFSFDFTRGRGKLDFNGDSTV